MTWLTISGGSALLMLALVPVAPMAQELSADRIRCQLDPQCPKPGIRGIEVLKGPNQGPPNSASFHINFDYDSSDLMSDSLITLDALGQALSGENLRKYRFRIVGHTDARGSDDYNMLLSTRRAEAVKQYLSKRFSIPSNDMAVEGVGEHQPLDESNPEADVNRRVQVINAGSIE